MRHSPIIFGLLVIAFLAGLVSGAGAAYSCGWLEGYNEGFRLGKIEMIDSAENRQAEVRP